MKGLLIFGGIIVGSLYIIFHPGEKLEHEIEEANIKDKDLKSVRILNDEKRKEGNYESNIEIIRKINSEEMHPTLNYSEFYLLTKKNPKKSPSHNRIEGIFGEMAPFPEYEFNTKITIPEPNPYPKAPCEAL